MECVREVCEKLDALVILEGTQSMTDCVKLAEYFLQRKTECRIVGVPSLCRTTRRLKQVWDLIQFQDVMLILSKIWKLFVNPRVKIGIVSNSIPEFHLISFLKQLFNVAQIMS